MFLVRLVYVSAISNSFKPSDLEDILKTARENNRKNCVTGLLGFNRNMFLQCLEGSRTKVNETFHKILNDHRHHKVILLDYKEINSREFTDWSMGFIPESSLTREMMIRFSGDDLFTPYDMSGEGAHQLMVALKSTIPVAN